MPGGARAFLGKYVVERAIHNDSLKKCLVDIKESKVSLFK